MKKILQIIFLSLLFVPQFILASDAYIKTDISIGQGFLSEHAKKCYLITPEHVIDGAKNIHFMTADRKTHSAKTIKTFEVDLAILEVDNIKACRHKQTEPTTKLSSILKVYRDGVLKTRLSDGSTLQTKITIKGIDQTEYLQIEPLKKTDVLKQGYSGSTLYIAEQPAGMLLEVGDDNIGYIYRFDAITNKLSSYFTPVDTTQIVKTADAKNIMALGTIKGEIAKDKTVEHLFNWEENSPIKINIKKMGGGYAYKFNIFNDEDELMHKGNIDGGSKYDFSFTPLKNGTYKIQLIGTSRYGKYDIEVKQ